MAKLCLKKTSKRIPAKRRYKIEKKVRQHNKKQRRVEKKKPKAKKANKIVPIPNICPFKDEVLLEAEEGKRIEREERKKHLEHLNQRKAAEVKSDVDMDDGEAGSLASLIKSAEARQRQHDTLGGDGGTQDGDALPGRAENSLKAFYKEFRKVVDAADVVLEVVDARDPLGTRCLQVEEAVRNAPGNKRLVVVLNKADLVPQEVLNKWLKHFRRSVPAIAFKASTQQQKRNLGRRKVHSWKQKEANVSTCVGAEVLMSLLGNYCRNKGIKTAIHVGVVGLPNVGKSSIINSLKRRRACNVGARPGVTKNAQVVELDSKIKLLDSPGIVFASSAKNKDVDAAAVLKNAVEVSQIADPIVPATAILLRANKEQMMELYNLHEFDTPQEFFALLGQQKGKMKKTGVPDVENAARLLIEDWNRGKIKYYTQPPELEDDAHVSAAIVQEIAAEFDLDSFKEVEAESLQQLEEEKKKAKNPFTAVTLVMEPTDPVVAAATLEDDVMDEDKPTTDGLISENVTVVPEKKREKRGESKAAGAKEEKKEKTLMELEGNQKLNLHKKLSFKKLKKMQARNSRHASSLAGVLENFSLETGDDDYDFKTDFQ